MTPRRVPKVLALCALVVMTGCASATQPALEVAGTSYSRADLLDAVAEQLGAGEELPAVVGRSSFNEAANQLVVDALGAEIAAEVERRGVEPTAEDLAALGVPEDFDPETLGEQERAGFELQLNLTALDRAITAEGGSIDAYLGELFADVRLDPRYGVFDSSTGILPPPRSGDVVVAEVPLTDDAS